MNESVFAAHHLASHRAAQLAHENELLRSHAERHAATGRPSRATWLVTLTARFTRSRRVAQRPAVTVATAP